MRFSFNGFFKKYLLLVIIVLIGIIHGAIYIYIVPPWGHYDEPTHFEYSWMIANQPSFPKVGDYNFELRRHILGSMVRNNFYKIRNWSIDFSNLQDPVNIGINQIGDPPVYYFLASLPLHFMQGQSIESQLIACRCVSLFLFLTAVVIGWCFSHEIVRKDNPIRWMIPLSMVLIPALVELMTAMSNDSAAVLVYSLFLLFSVRLLKKGPHLRTIFVLILLVTVGLFTKSSTWLTSIAFVVALVLSLFREKRTLIGWGIIGLVITVTLMALFEWGDAALWYRVSDQDEPTRVEVQVDVQSQYAIQLVDQSDAHDVALYQTLLNGSLAKLSGEQVTIGAWMWADRTVEAYPPRFMAIKAKGQKWIKAKPVTLTPEPTFFAYRVRLPEGVGRAYIVLKPFEYGEHIGQIYYSNPILVIGKYDLTSSPQFTDTTASLGVWDGKPFTNLVRNAGTAQTWPKFRAYVYKIANSIDFRLAEGIGRVIYALDYTGAGWYTKSTLSLIFRSFWGKFGWGEITLMGSKPFRVIYIAMVVMAIGCILGGFKKPTWFGVQLCLWLGLNIFFSLGYAWFTGVSMNSLIDKPALPVARFIFPTILAILAFFNFGWGYWLQLIRPRFRWIGAVIFVGLFLTLDVVSVMTVYGYYWG